MNDYTAGKDWKLDRERHILESAFRLFSEKGIESVTMPEVAKASGVGRATLYRYFASKLDLVVAIGTWKWNEYIAHHDAFVPLETHESMTGAQYLRFYLDSFLDLYRNHRDILRFNYNFNSYLQHESGTEAQRQPYLQMVGILHERFHRLCERGRRDGTLRDDISETSMFSSSFHIMLAVITRYAVGLVYVPEKDTDPESELVMLEELLLSRFTHEASAP
ncbi:MAG: TetR/AcrR family transcriptional regulator [Clostridia bacterium]|nr:TetR/AcrR family transcriptional regulator [Clostridia bacterium]